MYIVFEAQVVKASETEGLCEMLWSSFVTELLKHKEEGGTFSYSSYA
jgi:hypothetical protein